jgi:hypothetical protein
VALLYINLFFLFLFLFFTGYLCDAIDAGYAYCWERLNVPLDVEEKVIGVVSELIQEEENKTKAKVQCGDQDACVCSPFDSAILFKQLLSVDTFSSTFRCVRERMSTIPHHDEDSRVGKIDDDSAAAVHVQGGSISDLGDSGGGGGKSAVWAIKAILCNLKRQPSKFIFIEQR